jgi:hypothetical protein
MATAYPCCACCRPASTDNLPAGTSSPQSTEHLRPWEVRWEEFAFVKRIGGGSFGKASGWRVTRVCGSEVFG